MRTNSIVNGVNCMDRLKYNRAILIWDLVEIMHFLCKNVY